MKVMAIVKFLILVLIISCSSNKKLKERKIQVSEDIEITTDSGQNILLKAGTNFDLINENLLIRSPGHISVLLVPIKDENQSIKIDLKTLEEAKLNSLVGYSLDEQLSEVLTSINEIQQLINEDKGNESLALINELQKKYPELGYLEMLKASSYVVLGEQDRAKELLKISIKKYPGNIQAQKFYESIVLEENTQQTRAKQ
jgi:hypothetical protein